MVKLNFTTVIYLPVMAVHLAYPLEGLGVVVAVSGVHSIQSETECWTDSRCQEAQCYLEERWVTERSWYLEPRTIRDMERQNSLKQGLQVMTSAGYLIFSPDDQHRPEDDGPGAHTAAPLTVPAASRE